jgi:UDP-glucose 6-dehydrogenase
MKITVIEAGYVGLVTAICQKGSRGEGRVF